MVEKNTPQTLSWKGGLLLLLSWVVVPILLLAVFEGGLRIVGYGDSTDVFCTIETAQGRIRLFSFEKLKSVYDPSLVAGESQIDFSIPEEKSDNTYRIFVFGGSAAQGWGYTSSFAQMLQIMLVKRFPGTRFEVYNFANAGLNSSVMRLLAREAPLLKPDAFLLYMGNNEVHGPYGLITEYNVKRGRVLSTVEIRLHHFARRFRLIQLFENLSRTLSWQQWTHLSPPTLRYDDPRLPSVWRNFKNNLMDMFTSGREAGAAVFISTLGANVRHWPPSPDIVWDSLTSEQRGEFERLCEAGMQLEATRDWPAALDTYSEAMAITRSSPYLLFRNAHCLWAVGDYENARIFYEQALEQDTFIWVRAKKAFNDTIRAAVEEFGTRFVTLVDGKKYLETASLHGVPGDDLFADACHLRPRGMYVLAEAFFDQLAPRLPDWVKAREQTDIPLPEMEEVHLILGMRDALSEQVLLRLIEESKKSGLGNVVSLQSELESIRNVPVGIDYVRQMGLMGDIITSGSEDIVLANTFVECLVKIPEHLHNTHWNMLERLGEQYAYDLSFQRRYAGLLYRCKREAELETACVRILALAPTDASVSFELFQLLMRRGAFAEAKRVQYQALENGITQEALFSAIYDMLKDTNLAAIDYLSADSGMYHDSVSFWAYLGLIYVKESRYPEAASACRHALELDTTHPVALNLLGRIEVFKGRLERGFPLMERPVSIPGATAMSLAEYYIQVAPFFLNKGDNVTALKLYQRAVVFAPNLFWPQFQIGVIHEDNKEVGLAVGSYITALDIHPDSYEVAARLDRLFQLSEAWKLEEELTYWTSLSDQYPESFPPRYFQSLTLRRMGRSDDAYSALRQLVDMYPEHPLALKELGALMLSRSEIDAGLEYMRKAALSDVGLQDGIAEHIKGEADCFVVQGQYDIALHLFEAALEILPTDAHAVYRVGEIYEALGDMDAAYRMYEKIMPESPDYPKALVRLGDLIVRKGDIDGGLKYMLKAIALDSEMSGTAASFCSGAAGWFADKHEYDAALRLYQAALEMVPGELSTLVHLGVLAILRGDEEAGLEHMSHAIALQPGLASSVADRCAEVAHDVFGQGQVEKALRLYDAALEMDPTDLWPLVRMGEIYESVNNPTAAQEMYERVLRAAPDSPVTGERLERLLSRSVDGDNEKAVALWSRLADEHPESITLAYYLAAACEHAGMVERAHSLYDKLIQMDEEEITDIHGKNAMRLLSERIEAGFAQTKSVSAADH